MAWECIEEEWRGKVTKDAIEESILIAGRVVIDHTAEYFVEPSQR